MQNRKTASFRSRRWTWPLSTSAALLACLLFPTDLPASTTWIGGTGSFSNGANWSTGYAPNGTDDVFILNGGTAQVDDYSPTQDATVDGGSTIEIFASPSGMTNKLGVIGTLNVGVTGLGTITIGNQSFLLHELVSRNSYLGVQSGSTGVINSTGGTFATAELYVGQSGAGSMDFTSGSVIYSSTAFLGLATGSSGSVNLQDSSWTISDGSLIPAFSDLTVGAGGQGELVLGNSQVQLANLVISDGAGTNSSVKLSGGSLTASKTIFVGQVGGASFASTNAAVQAEELFVGRQAGATGTVTVSGGSLTLAKDLHVGALGTGTFTASSGATMHSDIANIGFGTNAVGVLNFTGGSWTNTRGLFIGVFGQGTLNIGAGGALVGESGFLGQDASGTGVVSMDGGSWAMSNSLVLGVHGTGSLSASNGAQISSEWAQLGLTNGSSGTATLDGASLSVAQTLTVGQLGSGTILLTNGAHLGAQAILLASSSGVSGSLSVAGSTVTTENILAGSGEATLSFSSARLQLPTNVVVVDTLLIDGFAPGNVVIGNGGLTVDTRGGNAQIASTMDGAGSLTKTGAGRLRLDAANGYEGGTFVQQGVLEFSAGSAFGTGGVTMGTAELRAITNVTLSTSTTFLTVTNGQTAIFSANTGSTFILGTTDFTVENGAGFTAGSAGHTGTVVFTPGQVTTSSNVSAVHVQAGTLAAGSTRLAELTAMADVTTVAAGATLEYQDNLSSGGINVLAGAGTINTGTNSATTLTVNSGNFAGNIAGWGALVKQSAGTLTLSGQTAFTGGTTINAGTLVVDGDLAFGLGQVTVNTGGNLGGSGTVGSIFLDGGSVAPGSSPGTLVAQNLFWTDGLLVFELGPTPAASDLLQVTGSVQGYGTNYGFTFLDAGWVEGNTYDLITSFTNSIDLGDYFYSNGGGFAGNFAYSGSTLQFTVTSVPEPSTWALLLSAGTFAALRLRRRA